MRIYLATAHRAIYGPAQVLREERWRYTLLSYAHADVEQFLAQAWQADSCILIDSGAFTAYCQGTIISHEDYLRWAEGFRLRWESRVRQLEFLSLDVIGDQEATWRNYRALRMAHLPVIPVVTYGAHMRDVDRALDDGEGRLALGGLMPYSQRPSILRGWLDACFGRAMAYQHANGQLPRVHILGVAHRWVLERYPAASADSSAWSFIMRNGSWSGRSGLPTRLPPISRHQLVSAFALRQKIRDAADLMARVTAAWQGRGISFDD